jgi:Bifunctional DNA primase/polymerase, N-terminal
MTDIGFTYLSRGWHVLPLPPRSKTPPPSGYTGQSPHDLSAADYHALREEPRYAGGNLGLRLGDDVVGVDVDCYGTKRGAETLARLEKELGPLPATWVSTSRTDGSGIRFFRVARRTKFRSVAGPDIEIVQRSHRYAVVYPSLHPNGNQYDWISPDGEKTTEIPAVTDLPELPDAWLERFAIDGPVDSGTTRAVADAQGWLDDNVGDQCLAVSEYAVPDMKASAHDTMLASVVHLTRLAAEGHKGVAHAVAALRAKFLDTVTIERHDKERRSRDEAEDEFDRTLRWAIAHAEPKPDECSLVCASDFWTQRAYLEHIQQAARARLVSPWSLLGVVLAKVAAEMNPRLALPAVVGGRGTLDFYTAIVGPSGAGKSAVVSVADELRSWTAASHGVGSGEGLIHSYVQRVNLAGRGEPADYVMRQHTERCFVVEDEVSRWGALASRTGSTLVPIICTMWSGGAVDLNYADPSRRLTLDRGSYRIGMVVGVQPHRAEILLDDADAGTPQRFLWVDTRDSGAELGVQWPGVLPWRPPTLPDGAGPLEMSIPETAKQELRASRLGMTKDWVTDGLTGHKGYIRLKAAALLALLDGRVVVNDRDWELAAVVVGHSDRTLASIEAERQARRDAAWEKELSRVEERTVKAVDAEHGRREEQAFKRVAALISRNGGSVSKRDIARTLGSRLKDCTEIVLEQLEEFTETGPNGRPMKRYRRSS